MNHQFDAAFAGGAFSETGHLHAQNLEGGRDHAGLDATDEIFMLVGHTQGAVKVNAAFGDDIGDGRESGLADMQKRDYLRMAMRKNMPRETLESGRAGTAGVDDRCNARMDAC